MAKKLRKVKFRDTFDELKEIVSRTCILGDWVENRKVKQTFLPTNGGEINWWPSGKIEFKGDPEQITILSVSLRFGRLARDRAMYFCRGNRNGRCCDASILMPQVKKALAKSGQCLVLLNNKLRICDESERDDYRKLVAKGEDISFQEM